VNDEDGTRLFEGCLIALPLALAFWVALALVAWVVRS